MICLAVDNYPQAHEGFSTVVSRMSDLFRQFARLRQIDDWRFILALPEARRIRRSLNEVAHELRGDVILYLDLDLSLGRDFRDSLESVTPESAELVRQALKEAGRSDDVSRQEGIGFVAAALANPNIATCTVLLATERSTSSATRLIRTLIRLSGRKGFSVIGNTPPSTDTVLVPALSSDFHEQSNQYKFALAVDRAVAEIEMLQSYAE